MEIMEVLKHDGFVSLSLSLSISPSLSPFRALALSLSRRASSLRCATAVSGSSQA